MPPIPAPIQLRWNIYAALPFIVQHHSIAVNASFWTLVVTHTYVTWNASGLSREAKPLASSRALLPGGLNRTSALAEPVSGWSFGRARHCLGHVATGERWLASIWNYQPALLSTSHDDEFGLPYARDPWTTGTLLHHRMRSVISQFLGSLVIRSQCGVLWNKDP